MFHREKFIPKTELAKIVKSIEEAERNTSGEIRVHIEKICKSADPLERAVSIFSKLKMDRTKERNGVLIYIAYKSKKLAIIGDIGINSKVPENFWQETKDILIEGIKSGNEVDSICRAVIDAGMKLKEFFPYTKDDKNEQSNEVSIG